MLTDDLYRIRYRWRALGICLVVCVLSYTARHFTLDDALIYGRYVQHAIQGRGLVFNSGEHVNALTSLLDTWILLGLAGLFHGKILLIQLVLSAIFLAGAALLAEKLVPLSGIFLAASAYFYLCAGMETSLFLFLLALCVQAYASGRIQWLPVVCVLCALTRFEGAAMALVVAWQLWKQRRMPNLLSFLPAFLLIALYLAFNEHFYGHMLPQSATAKFGQGLSGYWGRWPTAFLRVPFLVVLPLGGSRAYIPLLLVLAWFGSRDSRMGKINSILLPFLIFLAAFYILFNIPGYHWYYAPFVFFLTVYGFRILPATRAAYAAALVVIVALAGASTRYLRAVALPAESYEQAGVWLTEHSAPNATVATVETGTIGWYCDRYVIDMVGLTTPQNARYTAKADFSSWFAERPDFVIVHPDAPFPWERVALASREYEFLPVHFDQVYILRRKTAVQP